MTVTDEMKVEAQIAIGAAMADRGAIQNAVTYAHAALIAAYPLIRAQVLEEAAMVCIQEMKDAKYNGDYNYGVKEQRVAANCAQAIRDMAKE